MEHQKLITITRGLQHAAAETNSLVAEQYIRILSEYFDHLEDGTLQARMVKVQLDQDHYAYVPLVSLMAPTGLALDRMRVELSIRLEDASEKSTKVLKRLRKAIRSNDSSDEDDDSGRAEFKVSLSPRTKFKGRGRPSDHVHIDLEFKSQETPESVMRVIETYTNMIEPKRYTDNDRPGPDSGSPSPTPGPDAPQTEEAMTTADDDIVPDEEIMIPEAEIDPGDNEATDEMTDNVYDVDDVDDVDSKDTENRPS